MNSSAQQHKHHWREVFALVIPTYQEVKSSHGTLGAMDYEQAAMSSGGGRCTKIVRPSFSDFVADVEIAARRALSDNPDELAFFNKYYALNPSRQPILTDALAQKEQTKTFGMIDAADVPNTPTNLSVMEKVGKMLIARQLYPIGVYFRSKDVRN